MLEKVDRFFCRPILCFLEFQISFKIKWQSIIDRDFRKPDCSSWKNSVSSKKRQSRSLRIDWYSLKIIDFRAIGRKFDGSCVSPLKSLSRGTKIKVFIFNETFSDFAEIQIGRWWIIPRALCSCNPTMILDDEQRYAETQSEWWFCDDKLWSEQCQYVLRVAR